MNLNLIADIINQNNFDINYQKILSNKKLDITLKPFTSDYLNKMINYFADSEQYEKCKVVKDFKDRMLNHEINYYKYY